MPAPALCGEFASSDLWTYTYDANNFMESYVHKNYNSTGTIVTSGDSAYYYFHTVSGVNEFQTTGLKLKIYPNPTTGSLTIESNSGVEIEKIEIYNAPCQKVKTVGSRSASAIGSKYNIDVHSIAAGIYTLHIVTSKGIINKMVAVQ